MGISVICLEQCFCNLESSRFSRAVINKCSRVQVYWSLFNWLIKSPGLPIACFNKISELRALFLLFCRRSVKQVCDSSRGLKLHPGRAGALGEPCPPFRARRAACREAQGLTRAPARQREASGLSLGAHLSSAAPAAVITALAGRREQLKIFVWQPIWTGLHMREKGQLSCWNKKVCSCPLWCLLFFVLPRFSC